METPGNWTLLLDSSFLWVLLYCQSIFLAHMHFLPHSVFGYFAISTPFYGECMWKLRSEMNTRCVDDLCGIQTPRSFHIYTLILCQRETWLPHLNIFTYLLNPLCVVNFSRLPGCPHHVALYRIFAWAAISGHLLAIPIFSLHVKPMPAFITTPI